MCLCKCCVGGGDGAKDLAEGSSVEQLTSSVVFDLFIRSSSSVYLRPKLT